MKTYNYLTRSQGVRQASDRTGTDALARDGRIHVGTERLRPPAQVARQESLDHGVVCQPRVTLQEGMPLAGELGVGGLFVPVGQLAYQELLVLFLLVGLASPLEHQHRPSNSVNLSQRRPLAQPTLSVDGRRIPDSSGYISGGFLGQLFGEPL